MIGVDAEIETSNEGESARGIISVRASGIASMNSISSITVENDANVEPFSISHILGRPDGRSMEDALARRLGSSNVTSSLGTGVDEDESIGAD